MLCRMSGILNAFNLIWLTYLLSTGSVAGTGFGGGFTAPSGGFGGFGGAFGTGSGRVTRTRLAHTPSAKPVSTASVLGESTSGEDDDSCDG